VCIGPGADATLTDYSLDVQGDDSFQDGSVTTGFLGVCDTAAVNDDVQVIPVGQGAPDAVAITAGPNMVLDTTPAGDDQIVGTDITTGADGVCDTNYAGDDVQVIWFGYGEPDAIAITAGPDGCLDTHISLFYDDLIVGATAICVGQDGVCATTAMNDDTQDAPVASGPACVGAGADNMLQTSAAGDDFSYGTVIVSGPDGICDTTAGDNDGDGVASSDASEVFEDLAAAGNVIATNMYNYTPGAGYGLYPSGWQDVEVNRAYWLRLTNAVDNTARAGELLGTDQTIPLAQGWNMIGHPFVFSVSMEDVMVTDGVETISVADAAVDPYSWLQIPFYYYESIYKTVQVVGGDAQTLDPWRGYWVLTYAPNLELIVPIPRPY